MNKPLYSREYQYMDKFGSRDLDSETLKAIKEKRIILEDEPLYVRRKVTGSGGGEIDLLRSDMNEAVGVTNIDKQTLPKYVNFILGKIHFGYGKSNDADTKAESVSYSSQRSEIPVALQHANLIIKQNDVPLLTVPVKSLLQDEKTREFLGDAGYELTYPRIIKQNVKFQISIKFPEDVALPGADQHYVEVFLKGTRTRLRAAS